MQALASLAGLPSRQADDDGFDKALYFVALQGVTRYALSEAVKAISRGALGHAFFPSPPEFRMQCDAAQHPVNEQARRIRLTEAQMAERAEHARYQAMKTPKAKARVSAAYERFCADYEKPEQPVRWLDPELVAQVPDAPTKFKQARVG